MHNKLGVENDRRFIFLLDLRYIFFSPSSELFQNYCTCIPQGKQSITSFSAKLIGHLDQYLSALDCFPVPAFILQHVSFQNSSFIFPFTLFYFLQTDILGQCLPPVCHTFNLYNIHLCPGWTHLRIGQFWREILLLWICECKSRIILILPFSVCHLQMFTLNCSSECYLSFAFFIFSFST